MSPDQAKVIARAVAAEVARQLPELVRSYVPPEFLTTDQVAAWTGYTVPALEMMRTKGQGPRYLKQGRLVRYEVAAVREWFAREWDEVEPGERGLVEPRRKAA